MDALEVDALYNQQRCYGVGERRRRGVRVGSAPVAL